MVRPLARVVAALALLLGPALVALPGAAASASSSSAGWRLSSAIRFSPNADGVKDVLAIRYRLPVGTRVRLTITPPGQDRSVRRVDLGEQPAGTHTWTWDGHDQSGDRVLDRSYVVRLLDDSVTPARTRASRRVHVDTVYDAAVSAPTYGLGSRGPARVFPRTTVVTDALDIAASGEGTDVVPELVIRDGSGRVVRRADVDEPRTSAEGDPLGYGRTVSWAAVRGGRPLPRGRYTAVVVGRDKVGNRGRSRPLRIWVSDDVLEWRETTTTLTPAASEFEPCTYSSANGCGEVVECGEVVASTLYAGGLSYRSAPCDDPAAARPFASADHLLEVPEARGVRGLDAVRVTFVGAPTTPGEPDTGTLAVSGADDVVVGTSGQTPWIEDPAWGDGDPGIPDSYVPARAPAADWRFTTHGTDSVDVATFTVDVRYLAVRD